MSDKLCVAKLMPIWYHVEPGQGTGPLGSLQKLPTQRHEKQALQAWTMPER
jgi:hypothetical protein